MHPEASGNENAESRRSFIRKSSVGSLGLATASMLSQVPPVHAGEGDQEFRIGVIGCGGRGTGAVLDAFGAAAQVIYPQSGYHTEDVADGAKVEKKQIRVVALADMFDRSIGAMPHANGEARLPTRSRDLLYRLRCLQTAAWAWLMSITSFWRRRLTSAPLIYRQPSKPANTFSWKSLWRSTCLACGP